LAREQTLIAFSKGGVMDRAFLSRSVATAFAFVSLSIAVPGVQKTAHAAWIDAATGLSVRVDPPIAGFGNVGTFAGRHIFWDPSCFTWRDAASGDEVRVNPPVAGFGGGGSLARRNMFWQPCTRPRTASSPGLFLGGGLGLNSSHMGWTEVSRATGDATFRADDSGVGAFGRLEAGALAEWNEGLFNLILQGSTTRMIDRAARDVTRFILGAKAQIDVGSAQVSHDFPNGSVFRSNIELSASILGIAGVQVAPQAAVYGLLGPSLGRENVTINFGGPITDETHWTPGITAGLGTQFLLPYPGLSMGVEWQHTWWSGIDLDAPAASPGFNYRVDRQSDTLGITLRKKIN
jgi:hypothetical protein